MRRALVVGGARLGLTGLHNDVSSITEVLRQRGFTVDVREEEAATRAGILDGYEKLIADTDIGDVAVFAYAGHGGKEEPDGMRTGPQADVQYIVPFDVEQSTEDDFRGITSLELRVLLARLTQRSTNCLVLLDCCHSAHMSRDPGHRPRALPRSPYFNVVAHNEKRRREGMEVDLPDVIGNRFAVRMVACAPEQSAYEYQNARGEQAGMFTESFCLALTEAGDQRVSWASLLRRVRRRVELMAPAQTPAVEGPSRRLLFTEDLADQVGVLAVVPLVPSRVELPGARLAGVLVGDEFAITPADDERAVVAAATVDRVRALRAEAVVTFQGAITKIPADAVARPRKVAAQRWPVRVNGNDQVAGRIRAALAADPVLRPLDDSDDDIPELAVVEAEDELSVRDAAGPLVAPTRGTDEVAVKRVIATLAKLARVATLRGLHPDASEALQEPFTVEWGLVVDGKPQPLRSSGEVLHPGDQLYFKLRNDSGRKLYFNVLDYGVDAAVSPVLMADLGGLRLDAGEEYVIGLRDDGELEGVTVTLPPVPAGVPRPEAVQVIVSGNAEDLTVVCQDGVRDPAVVTAVRRALVDGSSLQRIFAHATVGGSRNIQQTKVRDINKFAVARIDFLLSPVERPPAETPRFLVDERQEPSVVLLQPKATGAAEVAIRLRELTSPAGRRVDVLVVTGGSDGVPVWRANTVELDTSLPEVLLERGPAVGQLDVALWVTEDVAGSAGLDTMLREDVDANELRAIAVRLAGQAPAQPWTAAPVASAFASALVVEAAHRRLSAIGACTPVLRATLLARESFGAGRHPHSGLCHAGGISFAYDIKLG